jgi:hypothetical protein
MSTTKHAIKENFVSFFVVILYHKFYDMESHIGVLDCSTIAIIMRILQIIIVNVRLD